MKNQLEENLIKIDSLKYKQIPATTTIANTSAFIT
jgi:hypothetical protein